MTRETDFLVLYQELGLDPGSCSIDEFKYAYRRRVARLHPDRHPGTPAGPRDAERLQRLTVLYDAALDFQRRYGRLPGAEQASHRPAPAGGKPMMPPVPAAPPATGLRWVLLGVLILAGLAWGMSWVADLADQFAPEAPPAATDAVSTQPPLDLGDSSAKRQIKLGMDAESVRRLQGDPVTESREHWDYGPSWIQFDKGKVTGWYSSPLRPLKVADTRPDAR